MAKRLRKLVDDLNRWILEKKVTPKQHLNRSEIEKMTGECILEYAQGTRYDYFGERMLLEIECLHRNEVNLNDTFWI